MFGIKGINDLQAEVDKRFTEFAKTISGIRASLDDTSEYKFNSTNSILEKMHLGLKSRVKNLEAENAKQKALLNELIDYVYAGKAK